MSSLATIGLLLPLAAAAQNQGLGRIDFPTSGTPAAQARFERGVLYLHSFEYDDARAEFAAAQKIDPGFAMAYWGEAMSYNEPLWFAQRRDLARAALDRLAATPAERLSRASSQRERDYLTAIELLYGSGTKEHRDSIYADAMRRLHEKHPADVEAAAFYALALIGTCHRGREFAVYMKAAAILEEAFAVNPQHPGVLHYLIHCYDDPVHAPLGLRAAKIYAKSAPEAAHARHMPSHIFVAMGMWDEVVSSNEDSWAAAVASAKRRGRPIETGGYHALWWLAYGYLQQGRYTDARTLVDGVERDVKANPAAPLRFHLAVMLAAFRVETGEPRPVAGGLDTYDLDLPAIASDLLAAGLVAMNKGWRAEAERALDGLRKLSDRAKIPAARMDHAHLYSGDRRVVEIAERELTAAVLAADGKTREALDALAQAVSAEDAMPYEFGPPHPPKPARELYGEMLLQIGRATQAREQFERALVRAPGRALSLLGLARSYAAEGNTTSARRAYERLNVLWRRADPGLRIALEASLAVR